MKSKIQNASKLLKSKTLLTAGAYSILRSSDKTDIVPSCADVDRLLEDDDIATTVALAASGVAIADVPEQVANAAVDGLAKLEAEEGSEAADHLFDTSAERLTKMGTKEAMEMLGVRAHEEIETMDALDMLCKRAFEKNHPNNGGSPEALERVKQAYRMFKPVVQNMDTPDIYVEASSKTTGDNMSSRKEVIAALEQTKRLLQDGEKVEAGANPDLASKEEKLARDIMQKGMNHPAMKVLTKDLDAIEKALADSEKSMKALDRVGSGYMEAPNQLKGAVIPKLETLEKRIGVVISQIKKRIGG